MTTHSKMAVSVNCYPQRSVKSIKSQCRSVTQSPLKCRQQPVYPQHRTVTIAFLTSKCKLKIIQKLHKSYEKVPVYKHFEKMKWKCTNFYLVKLRSANKISPRLPPKKNSLVLWKLLYLNLQVFFGKWLSKCHSGKILLNAS